VPAFFIVSSSGGVLAIFCGLAVYLCVVIGFKWWILASCSVAVLIYGVLIDTTVIRPTEDTFWKDSIGTRIKIWILAWEKFKAHWLFGHGLGQWQTLAHEEYFIQKSTRTWHARAHSEFIQGVVEMGAPFLVVVTGYFVDIARRLKKHALIPLTALVIIVVNSLVNFPFHIPSTGMIAVTWLAIMEVQLKEI